MEQEQLIKIKKITEGLIISAGFSGQVTIEEKDEGVLVEVESHEAGYLIGRDGDNLRALQQLIRAIISRKVIGVARLIVDINNYQKERLVALKEAAQNLAKEVLQQKVIRFLPPMNAYERRIIHLSLIDMPGIKTESEGEGENRRIVIKPL